MEGQRNIEFNFNDNTKTVNVTLSATEDNWHSLAKKVCEVFDIKEEQAPGLKLKYTDDEGDIVTLDSDAELRQALLDAKTQPKFVISLTSVSKKDEQRRMSKEERLKRKEERMKAKQERLERKKLKLAMKQEWKLRKEEDKEGSPAVLLSSDREKEHADRLARKQERLAHREERLKRKAERMARRGEKGPIDDDADARQKRREEKEQRRQERILKRQEKRKARDNSADADNAGGSPPKLSKEERRQERLASRMARRGEKGPIDDDEARQKRREEKEQRRQDRILSQILKRQEKRKARDQQNLPDDADNAGGSPPKLSKEERRQKRPRCEARNLRGDARKDDLPFYSLDETKAWPEKATQLYLDGNNMMFLTSTLRNLTLKRASGGARKAESLLESVADAFVAAMGDRIKQAVLIFDHTSTERTKIFPNGTSTLRVCSARPRYPTSDDALIDWAKQIAAAKDLEQAGGRMLFVTSDRGLGVQLLQSGGVLIKPKQFLYFACQTVTGNNDVDAWLDSLLA